jgi:preprotein translocase subunit SecG
MILAIIQIIIALIIIGLILLQERSSGLSGIFGGESGGGNFYQARRGMEKVIFVSTIVFSVIFVALAILQLLH